MKTITLDYQKGDCIWLVIMDEGEPIERQAIYREADIPEWIPEEAKEVALQMLPEALSVQKRIKAEEEDEKARWDAYCASLEPEQEAEKEEG